MASVGSSGFSVEGSAYNYVQGDQIINTTQIVQQEKREYEHIYDEFDYIKLGHIRRLWDIDLELESENTKSVRKLLDLPQPADMKICIAELPREKNQRFMVVSYTGPEAEKAWEGDFLEYSRVRDAKHIQLFGINRSDIPMLIFHDELIPVSHMWNQISKLGQCYLATLSSDSNMQCLPSNLWMDHKRADKLPSSVEFLKDEVFWRYLHQFSLEPSWDRALLRVFANQYRAFGPPLQTLNLEQERPISVISRLTNFVIAVGTLEHWEWDELGFGSEAGFPLGKSTPNGSTSISLTKYLTESDLMIVVRLTTSPILSQCAWLSQALSAFHKHGISRNTDLSEYRHAQFNFSLRGRIKSDECARRRRKGYKLPLYLVVPPHSQFPELEGESHVSLHVWSNDENGSVPIPTEECEALGLPTKFWLTHDSNEYCWSTTAYEMVHKWQVARGFDPQTTSFAEYCGYPVYKVPSRFTELGEVPPESNVNDIIAEGRMNGNDDNRRQDSEPSFWSMFKGKLGRGLKGKKCPD
ncbi:hypothetical protein L218DRAFT_1081348 [Marasmius fiardii PR-910]|nr:hypothetical protein L218DRAFT_1081348 [Marasmius fiardii PR-910]